MLLAFEGTGPSPFARNDLSCYNGYIVQFARNYTGKGKAQYFPGPSGHGFNCGAIMNDGCQFIESKLREGDEEINLVGHSRGAYVAMSVARYLSLVHKKTVNFLGLFDPVAMAALAGPYNTNVIPGTCRYVYVAFRHPDVGSRPGWGYTGTIAEPGPWDYQTKKFMTSHSGVGGFPSPNDVDYNHVSSGGVLPAVKNQDEMSEAQQVGIWMSNFAIQRGLLNSTLVPVSP